jgi:hypothetical protein
MSETYDYIRYEDEYIKVEQIGKSGWIANFRVHVKHEDVKVVISQVSWTGEGVGYIDGVIFDDVIMSDHSTQSGFTIGRSDNPLKEHAEYTVMSSYELYIGGVYIDLIGFGFTFMTTSRYEAQDIYPAPSIYSIREDNFYSEFSAVIQINEGGIYCDYFINVTITDSLGNVFEFDNSTLFLISSQNGFATYIATVPRSDISYGKIHVYVETIAEEKSLGAEYRDIKSKDANFYRIFSFNNLYGKFYISADEWNTYNETFAAALANSGHGNYQYDTVIPGQEMTIRILNQPINAYYNAFGWYYEGLTPRSGVHMGKLPEAVSVLSAFELFSRLQEMLNSLIYTEGT